MHKLAVIRRLSRYLKRSLRLATAVISFLLVLWLQSLAIANPPSIEFSTQSDAAANLVAQAEPTAPSSADQTSINQGIADYNNGQFSSAIARWQTALERASDPLASAYLLSNIATAQQQLGQQQLAQNAIEQATNIIQDWPTRDLAYWEVSARVLNTQGQTQWQQGEIQDALTTWQRSEQHYRQSLERYPNRTRSEQNEASGLVLTQVNQALALQELGFNTRAVQKLAQLSSQIEDLPPSLQLTTTAEYSRALRQVGEPLTAQSVLSSALSTIPEKSPKDPSLQVPALKLQLELANTERSLSHRAIAIGDRVLAKAQSDRALSNYAEISRVSLYPQIALQAQLNQLSYLIEIGQLEQAASIAQTVDLQSTDSQPTDPQAIPSNQPNLEETISYAHSLNCLQSSINCIKQEWQSIVPSVSENPTAQRSDQRSEKIATLLQAAIAQAKSSQNSILESYAVGELGRLYELAGRGTEAVALTEQALALIEGKQRPETAYLWEWQLGRIYQDQSKNERAIAAYQQAIQSLAEVRQNLISIDAQAQFSFLDNVEPVYRGLVSLLLGRSSASSSSALAQASLRAAVQTIDALQLTELENFLGCNLSALVNITEASTDPNAIKIYPIILSDRLAIITEVAGAPLQLQTVSVSQTALNETIAALRANLTLPGKTPQVLSSATQLYDWLIAPIAPIIANNAQIQTLVFVPDGRLRNIPMGVLYDGEQYLIEKDYALAIAPQLDLFAPAKNKRPLRILTGGISLAQTIRGQQFAPIEFLDAELKQIPEQFTVAPPLLNEAFTQSNLEQQLSSERYTAIHWKTHGVFSSVPAETFLVAYQDGITANELSTLVKSASEQQTEPLELVVLSACETAQGDRRAVLGLAGIAVRAGSRSTLSTLWRADDGANTQLMDSFYQGLQAGLSKSQALQNAQQSLLTEGGYPAPYYWAPYILVGNWL